MTLITALKYTTEIQNIMDRPTYN